MREGQNWHHEQGANDLLNDDDLSVRGVESRDVLAALGCRRQGDHSAYHEQPQHEGDAPPPPRCAQAFRCANAGTLCIP
jgi:hypothetical protein